MDREKCTLTLLTDRTKVGDAKINFDEDSGHTNRRKQKQQTVKIELKE